LAVIHYRAIVEGYRREQAYDDHDDNGDYSFGTMTEKAKYFSDRAALVQHNTQQMTSLISDIVTYF
jgi:hypothetical protein